MHLVIFWWVFVRLFITYQFLFSFFFPGAFLSLHVGKISECSYHGLTGDHCYSALVLFSFYERILFFCKFVVLGNLRTVETGMNKECKKQNMFYKHTKCDVFKFKFLLLIWIGQKGQTFMIAKQQNIFSEWKKKKFMHCLTPLY